MFHSIPSSGTSGVQAGTSTGAAPINLQATLQALQAQAAGTTPNVTQAAAVGGATATNPVATAAATVVPKPVVGKPAVIVASGTSVISPMTSPQGAAAVTPTRGRVQITTPSPDLQVKVFIFQILREIIFIQMFCISVGIFIHAIKHTAPGVPITDLRSYVTAQTSMNRV